MTLDQICQMTNNPSFLNALHACREGHPWNKPNTNHWRNAWFLACQQPGHKVSSEAIAWLKKQAVKWQPATPADDLCAVLERYINAYPAFRMKPVGAPNSPKRIEQENLMALEDAARAAIAKFRKETK